MDLRQLGRGRPSRCETLHADRDRQAQWCRATAWLSDILSRLPGHPARHIDDLLPWSWTPPQPKQIVA
ncbi:transposase domain-containing protein [Methylobacterium sp. GXS13]|uniref:transposase domain-containing protein n=1 Tax=Methylobacterium sp. GXS13 TaxID=1730094 RepID=UPI003299FD32